MSESNPLPDLWMQQGLIPIEHPELILRVAGNKRTRSASVSAKVRCVDTDELLGLWAGRHCPIDQLEARAVLSLGELLKRLELDLKSQEPF